MSQYSTGTATVTNSSPTVTGSGTLWSANVSAADSFTIAGDGVMYDVASVDSDTQVTLSVASACFRRMKASELPYLLICSTAWSHISRGMCPLAWLWSLMSSPHMQTPDSTCAYLIKS